MSGYSSLWIQGSSFRAALFVKIVGGSDKAMQFEVVDNPKLKFWIPSKACTDEGNGQYSLAFWFKKTDFLSNVFSRYASYYKR